MVHAWRRIGRSDYDQIVGVDAKRGGTNVTIELYVLLSAVLLGLVHISTAAFTFKAQVGNRYTVGARDADIKPAGISARLYRANANFLETFGYFAACVIVGKLAGATGRLGLIGCGMYIVGRILYLPLYAAGVAWLRSFSWNIATLGIVLVGVQSLPLAAAETNGVVVCDTVWHDATRNRDLRVRIRLPAAAVHAPVVLFSHGLGGSVAAGTRWAADWTNAGFAVIHLQHPGSDASVWESLPQPQRAAALKGAVNAQQLVARVQDVNFAVETVIAHGKYGDCDLARVDSNRIGLAGHSMGASTVQAVAGQRFPVGTQMRSFADPRIKAFIAFSPSAPPIARAAATPGAEQTVAALSFDHISAPFLSVTGTRDTSPIDPSMTAISRQLVFRALPKGNAYLLVMNDADHIVLGGGNGEGAALRTTTSADDAGIERVVGQVTTLFWLATLTDSPLALKTLKDLPAKALRPGDKWEVR